MSDILDNALATLESLKLEGLILVIDHEYTGTSNIKTLPLNFTALHDKSDDFILRCFPKISTLTLECCYLHGDTFNLAKTNLLTLYYNKFEDKRMNGNNIVIVTLENKERRFYHFNNDLRQFVPQTSRSAFSPQLYLPYKSYLEAKIKNTKYDLVFICNSLGSLVLMEL